MKGTVAAAALAGALALFAAGSAHAEDITVTSFDGTPIVAHWFPNAALAPGQRAPVVLHGPGWSQPGADDPATGVIKELHDQGYNVLTWDPRGFGKSGGLATIDAPQVEGRDVQALVDWVAAQPPVQLDAPGDPRAGMFGGSYGGAIQYSTASIDGRLDALVAIVGWHSLRSSLYKDSTFKQGWNTLLYGSAASKGLDPHIRSAYAEATATGKLSAGDEAWFVSRGPGDDALRRIRTPTLVVGGTIDTLFPLDEDVRIYRRLKANDIPVKMAWICGGHGACLVGNGGTLTAPGLDAQGLEGAKNDPVADELSATWLARYLKADTSVSTGPAFEARSDDGRYYTATRYPVPRGTPWRGHGAGVLRVTPGATSGTPIAATPAPAGAVRVPVTIRRPATMIGAPWVRIDYRATGTPADARVCAQLVNTTRNVVVGNNATPIPLKVDGKRHHVRRKLVPVISTPRAGDHYELQLIAGTKQWADQRATAMVRMRDVRVRVPTAKRGALTPR
jgi:ABC-2 type transport system ATP-binding protein